MTKKVQHFLSLEKTQRIIYLLAIPMWTCMWWFDDLSEYPNKTLDMVWAIPTAILLIQMVLNSKTIWRILFLLTSLYSFTVTIGTSMFFIAYKDFTLRGIFEFIIPITFLAFTTYIIYRIKPIQSQTSTLRAIIEL